MKQNVTIVIDFQLDLDNNEEIKAIRDAMIDFYTDHASVMAAESPVTDYIVTATIN
jgi:hypothetical protein